MIMEEKAQLPTILVEITINHHTNTNNICYIYIIPILYIIPIPYIIPVFVVEISINGL